MNTNPANLYSLPEFAARNKISKSTIYVLIKDGNLEITKRGHKTYISADQERAYLDSLPTGGTELLNTGYQDLPPYSGEAA